MQTNTIIEGDCLQKLKELPDESVNCVVTSPPYWALRDYGVEGQLGLEPTFQEYITSLCNIFDEVKRVLRKDGTCWVNMGDTYGGSGKGCSRNGLGKSSLNGTDTKRHKEISKLSKESWRFNKKPDLGDTDKSLCQIPSRFAIEMSNRGWILRNRLIWWKPNAMPSSVKDRFTVDYEDVFFFVKSKKYWFEQLLEPHESKPHKYSNAKYEAIGKTSRAESDGSEFYNPQGRNKRCVWNITTKPFREAHFATYPEALIEPMIKSGCPIGGVVLDPFFGAGTTGLVAIKQNKNYIGIELNPAYIEIARKRIEAIPNKLL